MRPVINPIDSFDAKKGKSIEFYYGGEQSYGSLLKVYRITDFSTPVYTNRATNMQCMNSIEGGYLTNGEQYAAEIISYHYDTVSEVSNKVYFWCYATPVFKFTNITEGEIFNSQSITANLLYEQSDGIDISQFKYALYDSQMALISETPAMSNYQDNKSHNYNGLENNAIYYIRAYGSTTNGQVLDTGFVTIFIQFEAPDSYSTLYANADNINGIIEYNTNIRLIEPNRNVNTYQFDMSTIDLEDDRLVYDTNFVIDGDFIMAIRHKYTIGEILTCSNPDHGFKLRIVPCAEADTYRYKLTVPNEISNYILYSEEFVMDDTKMMTCWIRRINNLYELTVYTDTDSSDEYNLFLGSVRPSSELTRYDVWLDVDGEPTVRIDKDDVVIWQQLEEPVNPQVNDIWIDIDMEE